MKPKITLKNLDKERRGSAVDRMVGYDAQPQAGRGGGPALKSIAISTNCKIFIALPLDLFIIHFPIINGYLDQNSTI